MSENTFDSYALAAQLPFGFDAMVDDVWQYMCQYRKYKPTGPIAANEHPWFGKIDTCSDNSIARTPSRVVYLGRKYGVYFTPLGMNHDGKTEAWYVPNMPYAAYLTNMDGDWRYYVKREVFWGVLKKGKRLETVLRAVANDVAKQKGSAK